MAEDTDNAKALRERITELVREEHRLRTHDNPTEEDRTALSALEVELDQAWDLLRQRRALSEAGLDPTTAESRPAREVEGYLQ